VDWLGQPQQQTERMLERVSVFEWQHQRTDVLAVNCRSAGGERLSEEARPSLKVLATEALRKRDADDAGPAVPYRGPDRGDRRAVRGGSLNAQTDSRCDGSPTREDVARDVALPLLIRPSGHPPHRGGEPNTQEGEHCETSHCDATCTTGTGASHDTIRTSAAIRHQRRNWRRSASRRLARRGPIVEA